MGILEDYLHKIPDDITLDVRVKDKVLAEIRIKKGQLVLMSGFGVGRGTYGEDTGLEANALLYRA